MKINPERLWGNLQSIGRIGADKEGGVSRFAWTSEYREAAERIIKQMTGLGLSVRTDTVGNVYGRLEGSEELPAVLTGSHLDTVPRGGLFDGMAGVASALEVLTVMKETGFKNKRPVELVAFINEEASQFRGGLFGSKAVCGMLADNYADTCFDRQTDVSLREAMLKYGMELAPDDIAGSRLSKDDYFAFIELHIEQGAYLLKKDLPIAVVDGIAGIKQFYITLNGASAHAGGMSMKDRRDCVAAAAAVTCEVERLALSSGSDTRGTVGIISASPGEHNIIAGETVMSVDFREADDEVFERYYNDLILFTEKTCRERGLEYSVNMTLDAPPAHCDRGIVSMMESCAGKNGIPFTRMTSFSAHDAMNMARIVPMGMIFLRSGNNGVSHCPEEFTSMDDLSAGAQILLDTVAGLSQAECFISSV